MRSSALLSLAAILVSSCTSVGTDRAQCPNRQEVGAISMCLPEGYLMATSPFGEKDSVILTIKQATGDSPPLQIHVKHDTLPSSPHSSMDLAREAMHTSAKQAPDYTLLATGSLTVARSSTFLHIFSASPQPDTSLAYYQMVIADGREAYGLTATRRAARTDVDESLVRSIFESIEIMR